MIPRNDRRRRKVRTIPLRRRVVHRHDSVSVDRDTRETEIVTVMPFMFPTGGIPPGMPGGVCPFCHGYAHQDTSMGMPEEPMMVEGWGWPWSSGSGSTSSGSTTPAPPPPAVTEQFHHMDQCPLSSSEVLASDCPLSQDPMDSLRMDRLDRLEAQTKEMKDLLNKIDTRMAKMKPIVNKLKQSYC